MIGATVVFALIGIVLAATAVPMRALGIMIASMFLYPEYLRVPVGISNMSVPRLIGIFILIRMMSPSNHRNFKWKFIDLLIVLQWAWTVIAAVLLGSEFVHTSEMIGRIFDTVLIYFVARLCVAASNDYEKMLPPLVITAVIMGLVGLVECYTSATPYRWMLQYQTGVWYEKELEYRYGFLRAQGSMGHAIYFGMAMFLLLGVIYSIRGYCRNKLMLRTGLSFAFLGTLSSMSSGPQQAIVLWIAFNALYFRPSLIKPLLFSFGLIAVAMEFASNRHFWYLTEYINFVGGDYWYRAKLIDVAIAQWRDYWLIGTVASDIAEKWGLLIDGRGHVDIVDQYVIVAVESGLLGVAMFVAVEALSLRQSIRRWKVGKLAERQLAFGLAATLASLMVAIISVGVFSVPLLMMYVLFGLMTREPVKAKKARRRRGFAVVLPNESEMTPEIETENPVIDPADEVDPLADFDLVPESEPPAHAEPRQTHGPPV